MPNRQWHNLACESGTLADACRNAGMVKKVSAGKVSGIMTAPLSAIEATSALGLMRCCVPPFLDLDTQPECLYDALPKDM